MRARPVAPHIAMWTLTIVMWAAAAVWLLGLLPPGAVIGSPLTIPWWGLAIGFGATEILVIRLPFGSGEHSMTLSEVPLVLGLVFATPPALIAGRLVGSALALAMHRRVPLPKLASVLGILALQSAFAVTIHRAVLGTDSAVGIRGTIAVLAAMVVAQVVTALLSGVSRAAGGHITEPRREIRGAVLGAAVGVAATTFALVGVMAIWSDIAAVGIVATAAVIGYLGLWAVESLGGRYSALRSVHSFTQSVDPGGAHVAEQILAGVMAETGSPRALLILPGERDQFDLMVADESGSRHLPIEASDATIVISATVRSHPDAVAAGAVTLDALGRMLGDRPVGAAVAPLGAVGFPEGVIIAAGPDVTPGWSPEAADIEVLSALSGYAAATLERNRLVGRLQKEISVREHEALHDPLTGLPNRNSFIARISERLDADTPGTTAVLILDLDHFKEVNDTLGHEHGDQLLCEIANRLAETVRASDFIARIGGDEFGGLIDIKAVADTSVVASRIANLLRSPFQQAGLPIDVTASIGLALADGSANAETLIQRAEIAMYAAKAAGSGHEVYSPDLDVYSPRRLALAGELRGAIDAGEIHAYYQPQISVRDGAVVGVEALARWIHPMRGIVAPGEFIPIAEKTGLIKPLTAQIIAFAVRDIRRWTDKGRRLRVSVNVSPRTLLDPNFVPTVTTALEEEGCDPTLLWLEVTEDTLLQDSAKAAAALERLDALGVGLSIDDFGTGYSSLQYLRELPVDEVKIDRTFVTEMDEDEGRRVIVASTIDLGHRLGLRVVAEGVERQSTLALLDELNCDLAQGFLIGRPMPAAALEEWIAGIEDPEPRETVRWIHSKSEHRASG
ncbi:EAL domain-containing protein [bacterium]|nr:EAL domain-containing protein [bacterium]